MESKSVHWIFYVISELFSFIILLIIIWEPLYITGFRDSNMVRTGHRKEDIYKGFKTGTIASAPWALLLIVSFIFNMQFNHYRILNSTYWTFLTIFCNAFDTDRAAALHMRDIGPLGIIGSVVLLLIVPALTGTVYILGYKGIDLFSKLVYKNRKEK
ncbi:MAG: hypothetical protein IKZ47_06430 [Clostridia bacterium]|nr:hypothetical protein [Clostridia bacterium]